MNQPYTFDLIRIFLGESFSFLFLFEIFFRTSFVYVYTLLNIRLIGRRTLGQMTLLEFIIVIALGSSVGDPMFIRIPILHSMIVISTIVLIEQLLTYITNKSKPFKTFIEGKGIKYIEQIEYAFLEVTGQISIIEFKQSPIKGTQTFIEKQ